MLAEAVYVVGALVTLLCGVLLMRGYTRVRRRLLLWSALCFLGLSLSNVAGIFGSGDFPTTGPLPMATHYGSNRNGPTALWADLGR